MNILKNIEILDLKSSSLGDHLFKNSGTAIAPNTRRIDNCEADQAKHQLKQWSTGSALTSCIMSRTVHHCPCVSDTVARCGTFSGRVMDTLTLRRWRSCLYRTCRSSHEPLAQASFAKTGGDRGRQQVEQLEVFAQVGMQSVRICGLAFPMTKQSLGCPCLICPQPGNTDMLYSHGQLRSCLIIALLFFWDTTAIPRTLWG